MKVEIYSDIVCPWCYIGERRFDRAIQAFGPAARDVEVVFRPYQLDPGAPAESRPLRDYLAARYGPASTGMLARVTEVASGEGIAIDWESALAANTLAAHRLMLLAERDHHALALASTAPWLARSVGYVGTRAVDQMGFININAGPPGTGNAGRPLAIKFGLVADINSIQPYRTTTYDGLQALFTRR